MQRHASDEAQELISISTGRVAGAVVVTVAGDVDVLSGARLRTEIGEVLDGEADLSVVVDLTGVTLLGSTGLAVLVDAHWQAQQRGRKLVLVVDPRSRPVPLALHTAGIASLFRVVPDLGGAVRRAG